MHGPVPFGVHRRTSHVVLISGFNALQLWLGITRAGDRVCEFGIHQRDAFLKLHLNLRQNVAPEQPRASPGRGRALWLAE